jgi:hypothetical protein
MEARLLCFRTGIVQPISRLTTAFTRHCAPFRDVIPFPATQGPATEVTAAGRSSVVDSTTPRSDSAAVRLLLVQVLARSIGKEISIRFFETPFTEVEQLVGFALPDKDNRKPAAALSASAAGARFRDGLSGFHTSITSDGYSGKMVRHNQINMPLYHKSPWHFPNGERWYNGLVPGSILYVKPIQKKSTVRKNIMIPHEVSYRQQPHRKRN